MAKWINFLMFLILSSVVLQAQNDMDLSYFKQNGISIGVDDNRYSRIDFSTNSFIIGFSNTTYPSPIRKQFIDLSLTYKLKWSSFSLFPSLSASSNLRNDDLNINTIYFEVPILYSIGSLDLLLNPGYDASEKMAVSATASYKVYQDLQLYFQYGKSYNFNFSEEAFGIGLMKMGKQLSIKSGLQIPKNTDRLFVRLLTSFNYNFSKS